jgi:hypothetical protein
MDAPTDLAKLAAAVSASLAHNTSACFVRLASLAWLIARGLRRTACCEAAERDVGIVESLFGDAVSFEYRPPEAWRDVPYYLGDTVVLYAAGSRTDLEAMWGEHRVTYTQWVPLGRALGYFAPMERFAEGYPASLVVYHYVEGPAGTRPAVWNELVPESALPAALAAYAAKFEAVFAEIGLTYSNSHEHAGIRR